MTDEIVLRGRMAEAYSTLYEAAQAALANPNLIVPTGRWERASDAFHNAMACLIEEEPTAPASSQVWTSEEMKSTGVVKKRLQDGTIFSYCPYGGACTHGCAKDCFLSLLAAETAEDTLLERLEQSVAQQEHIMLLDLRDRVRFMEWTYEQVWGDAVALHRANYEKAKRTKPLWRLHNTTTGSQP